jgi:hypothetical protein
MANPNTKTMSVTMWTGQAELIEKAAKKAGVSASEIIRSHTIPGAARILGIEQPEFPAFDPPHFRRGAISLAAESLGLTPEQFKQRMAETAAEAIIKEATQKQSGMRVPEAVQPVRRRRRIA